MVSLRMERSSMNCDLCGRDAELYKVVVEDSQLSVCQACSGYGKVLGKIKLAEERKQQVKIQVPEIVETVVADFGELLKKKRAELGLNHKEFAKKIAEKESTLHKLEIGSMVPTLDRARKLEKMLGLKFVDVEKEEVVTPEKSDDTMTLGDFVKIRKKGN